MEELFEDLTASNSAEIEGAKILIKGYLNNVNRPGMDKLLDYMEASGFYEAPCSGSYHLAEPGGLARHSLNVADTAVCIAKQIAPLISWESLIIVGLLHDLGKMGDYGKPFYIPNLLKNGNISGSKPYVQNKELLGIDHEIKSIVIAERFIELTPEEEHAILYHNGLYTPLGRSLQGYETELQQILHFADMWCSRFTEMGGC